MHAVKRLAVNVALALAAVVFCLLVLEGALRIISYDPPDFVTLADFKDVNKLYRPNSEAIWNGELGQIQEFSNRVRTNSLALHDSEHVFEKPANTVRILMLGDSFVESHQVPLEQTFFKLLEQDLNAQNPEVLAGRQLEVIALGHSGHGSLKEYIELEQLGFKYAPDLVMVYIFIENDIKDDYYHYKKILDNQDKPRKPTIVRPKRGILSDLNAYDRMLVFKDSVLNKLIAFKLTGLLRQNRVAKHLKSAPNEDYYIYAESDAPIDPDLRTKWERALRFTAANYIRMQKLCQKNNAKFATVFINVPLRYADPGALKLAYTRAPEIMDYVDFARPVHQLEGVFKQAGIPSFDLTPGFERGSNVAGALLNYAHDKHWTPQGHRTAADLLKPFILDLIPPREDSTPVHE